MRLSQLHVPIIEMKVEIMTIKNCKQKENGLYSWQKLSISIFILKHPKLNHFNSKDLYSTITVNANH